MVRSERRWPVFAACAAAIALALGPTLRPAPDRRAQTGRAIVLVPVVGAAALADAAPRRVAERFLRLYAIAYGGNLTAAERRRWRSLASAGVAGFLLAQPPEQRLRGGRVISLELSARERGYEARAKLAFGRQREAALLSLTGEGDRDRSWRVTSFSPSPTR